MKKKILTSEQLSEIAREIASSNGDRAEVVERWASLYGCSCQQIYRWAKQAGYSSGRTRRSDAGSHRTEAPLADIERAAMLKFKSTTGKYDSPMPAEVALDIVSSSEFLVSSSRRETRNQKPEMRRPTPEAVNRLLRARALDRRSVQKPVPRITRRSERPNEEHQFDTSPCSIWYLDGKDRIRYNPRAGQEEGKPARGQQIIRYVLTDHFTHSISFQYQAAYESFISSARHFHFAWTRKADPELWPFCGVPIRLYVDQGPTYKSGHMKELCQNLGVALEAKQPSGTRSRSGKLGSPNALGSVESAHWLIETHFESRLRLLKPQSLEELNDWAYRWSIWYNGVKIHRRYHMTRSQLWSTIRSEELRIPPADLDIFMSLGERPAVCHIYGDLTIRFKGNRYLIENVPVDLRESDAEVMYSPYSYPQLRVRGRDGNYYLARPLARLDNLHGGYYENAVRSGDYHAFKDTTTERSQKFAEQFDLGKLDPFPDFAERLKNLRFMNREGQEIGGHDAASCPPISATNIPILEALEQIRQVLGRPITIEENEALRQKYGDWMTAEEIKAEITNLTNPDESHESKEQQG